VASLAVRPGARGCGVARALLTASLDDALARAARRVTLHVHRGNGKAMRLYERCGFVATRRHPGYYPTGGDVQVQAGDAIQMDFVLSS
jgi:ribosomal protein S18 acetylase RimI-like enzyme